MTGHNVLYVLLVGTVLTSFFSSIQSTLTRVMDPNEYDTLLTSLVASFSNINSEIIIFSVIILALIGVIFRKELALLDVITLGKEQAINLGVDYDRCIRRLLLAVTLCIAVATAMVGPISFLGLIIANISRQLLKTYRHTQLIAGAALMGVIALIGGQFIVERVFVYSIPKGKVTSLIGPNGAGKSTVMSIISRLIAADNGSVVIEKKDINKWNSKELSKHLAILTQTNNIQMKLTVEELVAFGRFPHSGGRLNSKDKEMIDKD